MFTSWLVLMDGRVERFTGTEIVMNDVGLIDVLSVSGQSPIIVEGASSEFFVLRGPNDQVIYGSLGTKPLGWPEDEYYQSGMSVMGHGKWSLEVGSDVSLHLMSELDMVATSRIDVVNRILLGLVSGVVGLLLWLLGYLFSLLFED